MADGACTAAVAAVRRAEVRVTELETALHHIARHTGFASKQEMRQYALRALEKKGEQADD